jgi:hypothetical protein
MMLVRRRRVAGVAVVAIAILTGCSDSPSAPAPVATTLRIEPGTVSLAMGASQQLSATALDQTGAPMATPPGGAEVIWSSGDTTLVTIDEAGVIQGRRPGTTTIVARAGTLEGSVAATVVPAQLVVESGRSVSAAIGPAGGVLVAEGAGGIRYRLEIPAAAVMEETTITLTPVASFGNAPFMQLLGAARFAPDGLELHNPGVLTIELTQTPPGGQIITGFTFSDDARDLNLWLANVSGRTVTMPIAHFSGAGVARVEEVAYYGRNASFPPPVIDAMMRILDVQIEYQTSGVWDVHELIDTFRQWYVQGVEPALDGAVTDEDVFDAIRSWRLWLSWILLTGDPPSSSGPGVGDFAAEIIEALGTEIDEARVLAAAAIAQGIDWSNAECIATTNFVHAVTVVALQQMAEEFGLDEPGTGLDAATVLAEICFQMHLVDIVFPAIVKAGEPAELIVRPGIGYGGAPPVEAWSTMSRTRITPSGSMDDSPYEEVSVEIIRQIVPAGDETLTIDILSCFNFEPIPGYSVDLGKICAADRIVRTETLAFRFDTDLEGWTIGTTANGWGTVFHLSRSGGIVQFDGVGGPGEPNSWIFKELAVPAGAKTLTFRASAHPRAGADTEMRVRFEQAGVSSTLLDWKRLSGVEGSFTWQNQSIDVGSIAGKTVVFFFEQRDNGPGSHEQLYLDDIVIQ